MTQKSELKIKQRGVIEGVFDFHFFDASQVPDIPDEVLEQKFKEQRELFLAGKSPHKFPLGLNPNEHRRYNTVCNGLIDTIINRMIDDATSTQTLEAKYLALGYGNGTPTVNDTELEREFYRATFTARDKVNNAASLALFVGRNTANGATATVANNPGNTLTSFFVGTGEANRFQVGDRIRVTTASQFNFVTITALNIFTDQITIGSALADLPVEDDAVLAVWAEAGVFGNEDASGAANTGSIFDRVNQLEFPKTIDRIVSVEVQFIYIGN